MFLEEAVQGLARGDVALESDEFLPVQCLELEALAFGERVVWMANQDKGVFTQRDDLQVASVRRVGNDAQVHDVAQDIFVYLPGMAVFDVDIGAGVALEELRQIRGQVVQAHAIDGRHPDRPGDDFTGLLEFGLKRAIGFKNLLAVLVEKIALGREPNFFLPRSTRSDLKRRSSEVICWLTAD